MDRRQKDIVTMAEHAELAVVSCEKKNSRQSPPRRKTASSAPSPSAWEAAAMPGATSMN